MQCVSGYLLALQLLLVSYTWAQSLETEKDPMVRIATSLKELVNINKNHGASLVASQTDLNLLVQQATEAIDALKETCENLTTILEMTSGGCFGSGNRKKDKDDFKRWRPIRPNATTSCPEGHFAVGRRCFFIPKDGQKTWEEAQMGCEELGGFLAEPQDISIFRRNIGEDSTHYGFWLGGSDRENEDIWKWERHGNMIDQHENWYPGEPNNYGGAEDCLFLVKDREPPLDDRPCDHLYYYVCERT